MKLFFILIFSSIILAGCSKNGDVNPQNSDSKSSSDSSKNSTGGISQTPPNTTPKLTHADSIHLAVFNLNPQLVITSVSGTELTLVFNENVNLLFNAQGYQETSAVHLLENFSNSLLTGFDYTTVAEGGNTTFDWVDDNLNNVILKTVTDTTVNKVKMVKINVHRPFTFSKNYSSNQAALNEQALFIQKTNDSVTFSSYCYYNQINYETTSGSAPLVYSK